MDRLNKAADTAANYANQASEMAHNAAQTASRFGQNQPSGQNQQNSGQNQQLNQSQQGQAQQQGQKQHGENCPSKQVVTKTDSETGIIKVSIPRSDSKRSRSCADEGHKGGENAHISLTETLPASLIDCLQSIKGNKKPYLSTPFLPTYNKDRLLYNKLFVHNPSAIFHPASEADAAAAVVCAASQNVSIVPRSGGHSFGG
ncbi:hypothetical protein BG003_010222 [Podila horticola]|nr:hypothetical protein BG003_010222 [Podila horticola]